MIERRRFIVCAMALAAARFLKADHATADELTPRLENDPFSLGVASGEPASDGFVIWTRVQGFERDLRLTYEIAEDDGFRRIARTGYVNAPAARGGAAHVEIVGLTPGRPWFYRFRLGQAISRTGRACTLPDRPERLRLALTSCQHWEQGWFSGYADMIAANPAAVLQVGDYIYEKSFGQGPDIRSFGTPPPFTLDEYRARHALYRSDPHLADAHAALPFILAWDDHEVENDYGADNGGVTPDGPTFLRRRAAAYQAYFEHMPLRPSALQADGGVRLHRRFMFGDLATVHVLDTRQYRTPAPCRTADHLGGRVLEACPAALDPAASFLGAAQEAWIADGLAQDHSVWTLLTQQTLFSRLVLPTGPHARYSDIWDGYPASRERLLGGLKKVANPIVLGGDVHSFWINDVAEGSQGEGPPVATEIVTSCLASRNGPEALFGSAQRLNPHVRHLDNTQAGYVLLDLDRERLTADLRAVNDLTDPASACRSVGRFEVQAGRPGAQPVPLVG